MKLYLSNTCSTEPPIAVALNLLGAAYTHHNIDQDVGARAQLVELTGSSDVPTLAFDDGTVLIQPTPQRLAEKVRSLLPEPEQPEKQWSTWTA